MSKKHHTHKNQIKEFRYLKSCKSQIVLDDMVYNNTEILRSVKLSYSDKKLTKNMYLDELFNESIYIGKANLTKGEDEWCYYIKTDLPNLVRAKTEQFYDTNIETSFCEISSKADEEYKTESCPSFYFDNLVKPLEKSKFIIDNFVFRILPEYGEYNTYNPYLQDEIDKILNNSPESYLEQLHEILYYLNFVILVTNERISKSSTSPAHIEKSSVSVFDLHGKTEILDKIKQHIKDYYLSNYKYHINEEELVINVISDYKYQCIAFRFSLKDPHIHNVYMSYVNYYRSTPIDMMYSKSKISYFTLVPKEQSANKRCIDTNVSNVDFNTSISRIELSKTGENASRLSDVLGFRGKKIIILNDFYKTNKYHSYCTQFFLIKVDEIFYEISIKSVTMKILREFHQKKYFDTPMKNNTIQKAYDDYVTFLQEFPYKYDSYKYKSPRTEKMLTAYVNLPGILEIYLKKIENPTRSVRIFVDETKKEYNEMIQTYKNLKQMPDTLLLIHLIWKSEYRRLFNQIDNEIFFEKVLTNDQEWISLQVDKEQQKFIELTKEIAKNPVILSFILGIAMFSENYIVVTKILYNNLINLVVYVHAIINGKIPYKIESIRKLEQKLLVDTIDYDPEHFPVIRSTGINMLLDVHKYLIKNTLMCNLWYLPEFKITNYDKYIDTIRQINMTYDINVSEDFNLDQTYKQISEYIKKFGNVYMAKFGDNLLSGTNFVEKYTSNNFLHHARDLKSVDIDQIQDMLDRYVIKYNRPQINVAFHYPNMAVYGILHLQIYTMKYGKNAEIVKRYLNINETRSLYWYKQLSNTLSK